MSERDLSAGLVLSTDAALCIHKRKLLSGAVLPVPQSLLQSSQQYAVQVIITIPWLLIILAPR